MTEGSLIGFQMKPTIHVAILWPKFSLQGKMGIHLINCMKKLLFIQVMSSNTSGDNMYQLPQISHWETSVIRDPVCFYGHNGSRQ